MVKIALIGASGKLGKSILKLAQLSSEYDFKQLITKSSIGKKDTITGLEYQPITALDSIDLVIEVASNSATNDAIDWCIRHKKPLVIGSTGHNESQNLKINASSKYIPIFYAQNFSVPLYLYLDLVKKLASFAKGNCYIDLIEQHRAEKKDYPSGTAKMIAETLNMPYKLSLSSEKRDKNIFHIHSIRGSDLSIEHELILGFKHESIQIKHSVFDRETYAEGALKAINFIKTASNGLYTMNDLLNQI